MRLQGNLERLKVKVNMRFWREFRAFVGREIQCIESLPSYLSTLQEKARDPNFILTAYS